MLTKLGFLSEAACCQSEDVVGGGAIAVLCWEATFSGADSGGGGTDFDAIGESITVETDSFFSGLGSGAFIFVISASGRIVVSAGAGAGAGVGADRGAATAALLVVAVGVVGVKDFDTVWPPIAPPSSNNLERSNFGGSASLPSNHSAADSPG